LSPTQLKATLCALTWQGHCQDHWSQVTSWDVKCSPQLPATLSQTQRYNPLHSNINFITIVNKLKDNKKVLKSGNLYNSEKEQIMTSFISGHNNNNNYQPVSTHIMQHDSMSMIPTPFYSTNLSKSKPDISSLSRQWCHALCSQGISWQSKMFITPNLR
jgi:hypothetical protein